MVLRILVVARWYPSYDAPGRGIFVADQAAALAATGAQVVVICPEPVYADGLHGPERERRLRSLDPWVAEIAAALSFASPANRGAAHVPVLRIPAPIPAGGPATRHPLELAALEAATLVPVGRALHAVWPFEVIHAHTGLPDGLAADDLARAVDVPLLTTEHDSATPKRLADPPTAEAYRRLLGPGRGLVAVSGVLARHLEDRLGLDPGRVPVVPNIVSLDAFPAPGDVRRDPAMLLWVGARKESKGTATLLAAVALVLRERPGTHLRMIGRAPSAAEEDRLKALAVDLGVEGAVTFEPPVDRPGVAAAMAQAAIFVHPSPWETFGIVAAEALAMGLPVAATPSGGVEEILGPDGRFGTIAAGHRPEDLAASVVATLDRRDTFDLATLRAHVVDRFAPAVVADRLLERLAVLRPTPGRPAPGLSVPPRADPVVVVVGFRRASAVARVSGLPTELAARLTLVTTAPVVPATGQLLDDVATPAGLAHWIDADVGQTFRDRLESYGPVPQTHRSWWALRHPLRSLARRRVRAERSAMVAEARRTAVGAALALASEAAPSARPMLLPLDADDLDAVEPFIAEDVADLAPGTFGWLVDRWETGET